jgi:hypothetical protein
MNRILTIFSFSYLGYRVDNSLKERFPPSLPPLKPAEPGFKVFGYMGCPLSKVEAINARARDLFFSDDIKAPQSFALRRTSFMDWFKGVDQPVVVQIEITKSEFIKPEDLGKDQSIQYTSYVPRNTVHLWPWIPPNVQQRCDLRVRVNHVVTPDVLQNGGHWYRAFKCLFEK